MINQNSMTYMYKKPEIQKKWYNSNGYSYRRSLYWVIKWKLLFDVEGMTLLVGEAENLVRKIFVVGKIRKFLAVRWDSSRRPQGKVSAWVLIRSRKLQPSNFLFLLFSSSPLRQTESPDNVTKLNYIKCYKENKPVKKSLIFSFWI